MSIRPGPCEKPNERSAEPVPPLTPATYRAVMTATILGSAIAFVDGSIVSVALPAIRSDLSASLEQLQWVVNGYALMLAAFILPGGAAGDWIGRKRVFLVGVAVHTLASLWCALANSAVELIVARIVQGIGGALMIPASLALITVTVPKAERGAAIGLWAGAGAAATAIGPILGGTLIDTLGWRAALFLAVPFGALTIAIAWRGVPESRSNTGAAMDWTGGVLACAALGGLALGLTAAVDAPGPGAAFAAAAGLVLLAGFLYHQHVVRQPMMPLSLFANKPFSGANALTFLLYGALGAVFFFLPITLIDAQGYSATRAGLALLPFTLVIAVFSRFAGTLADRYGARLPLTLGPFLTGIGFMLLAPAAYGGSFWLHLTPVMVLLGIGMGLTAAPLSATVMNSVEETRAGTASGINNAISRAAGLLFVAAFGIIAQAGFALSETAGRFGEPETAASGYAGGVLSGFAAIAVTGGLFAVAAAAVGYLTLPPIPPEDQLPGR